MRLGTRRSRLALIQSQWVADRLSVPVELVGITTAGDRISEPIDRRGITGVFVTALREALFRREVDVVVHSFKDLPTAPVEGITLAAVPERADPRDALVLRDGGKDLVAGARVGTGSARRAVQVRQAYPDLGLQIVPMRGNVDTRLRKLAEGQVDALVLAMAGLDRLAVPEITPVPLDPCVFLPAPAQGALAVECRASDPRTAELLAALDHPPTRAAITAERAFLAELQAGCTAPIGAIATLDGPDMLMLDGLIADRHIRGTCHGPITDAAAIGRDLARSLSNGR